MARCHWAARRGTRSPSPKATFRSLIRQATNPAIGLKLGEYIDIEADSPEEEQLVAKLFEGCDPPVTPTYRSTRGKRRIYRTDERFRSTGRAVVNFTNGSEAKLGIRIGANGMAAQSIIPPSAGREWEVSWDDVEPADLPDVVVRRILQAVEPPKSVAANLPGTKTATLTNTYSPRCDASKRSRVNRTARKDCSRWRADAWNMMPATPTAIATIRAYDSEQPLAADWSDADIVRRLRDAEQKSRTWFGWQGDVSEHNRYGQRRTVRRTAWRRRSILSPVE